MASLNVNSLVAKIDEVRLLVKNENIDILAISETKIEAKLTIDSSGWKIFLFADLIEARKEMVLLCMSEIWFGLNPGKIFQLNLSRLAVALPTLLLVNHKHRFLATLSIYLDSCYCSGASRCIKVEYFQLCRIVTHGLKNAMRTQCVKKREPYMGSVINNASSVN